MGKWKLNGEGGKQTTKSENKAVQSYYDMMAYNSMRDYKANSNELSKLRNEINFLVNEKNKYYMYYDDKTSTYRNSKVQKKVDYINKLIEQKTAIIDDLSQKVKDYQRYGQSPDYQERNNYNYSLMRNSHIGFPTAQEASKNPSLLMPSHVEYRARKAYDRNQMAKSALGWLYDFPSYTEQELKEDPKKIDEVISAVNSNLGKAAAEIVLMAITDGLWSEVSAGIKTGKAAAAISRAAIKMGKAAPKFERAVSPVLGKAGKFVATSIGSTIPAVAQDAAHSAMTDDNMLSPLAYAAMAVIPGAVYIGGKYYGAKKLAKAAGGGISTWDVLKNPEIRKVSHGIYNEGRRISMFNEDEAKAIKEITSKIDSTHDLLKKGGYSEEELTAFRKELEKLESDLKEYNYLSNVNTSLNINKSEIESIDNSLKNLDVLDQLLEKKSRLVNLKLKLKDAERGDIPVITSEMNEIKSEFNELLKGIDKKSYDERLRNIYEEIVNGTDNQVSSAFEDIKSLRGNLNNNREVISSEINKNYEKVHNNGGINIFEYNYDEATSKIDDLKRKLNYSNLSDLQRNELKLEIKKLELQKMKAEGKSKKQPPYIYGMNGWAPKPHSQKSVTNYANNIGANPPSFLSRTLRGGAGVAGYGLTGYGVYGLLNYPWGVGNKQQEDVNPPYLPNKEEQKKSNKGGNDGNSEEYYNFNVNI